LIGSFFGYRSSVTIDDWESWPWFHQREAACVTVVRGIGVRDVSSLWHDQPLTPLPDADAARAWQAYEHGEVRGAIAVGEIEPGVVFIWEHEGGFEASRPEVLADLSWQGSACVNYWNDVNCTPMFGYAVGGRVRRLFTTDDPSMSYGDGVDQPLPDEAALPWPAPDQGYEEDTPGRDGRASALELQARLMQALPADPSWLERPDLLWFGTPFYRDSMRRREA
jgi:hypothetical protein